MDKRGEERLLSIWMFGIWGVIAIMIVAGVFVFYQVNSDLRNFQAKSLNNKVSSCFVENSVLKDSFFSGDVSSCGFNEGLFNDKKYYFRATLYDEDLNKVDEVVLGNNVFEVNCELPGENFPRCYESKFGVGYVADENVGEGFLEIISGSNNRGEKL
jgi:hypothetical protein